MLAETRHPRDVSAAGPGGGEGRTFTTRRLLQQTVFSFTGKLQGDFGGCSLFFFLFVFFYLRALYESFVLKSAGLA